MALRALVAAAFAVPAAESYPTYIPFNPNGANVPMPGMPGMFVPSIGHINPAGGGDRNAYGKAFAAAGRSWSAQLCAEDSDGDGASNGLELGDPCCEWTGNSSLPADLLSLPGDATSTTNRTCGAIVCINPAHNAYCTNATQRSGAVSIAASVSALLAGLAAAAALELGRE